LEASSDHSYNNISKDILISDRIKRLLEISKKRKKRRDKINFEEKLEHDFLPYVLVQKIPVIEQHLFNRNAFCATKCVGALRDRFCFLMTTNGILRGESLFKADLSDICDFIKENEGGHDCQVMVMRIATGKANGLHTLYGRVIRHVNPDLCPIGALSF